MRKLEMTQAATPVTNTILLAEYGTDAGRLKFAYQQKVSELMKGRSSGGYGGTPWRVDDHDRVY
jgi:hypothetical protein